MSASATCCSWRVTSTGPKSSCLGMIVIGVIWLLIDRLAAGSAGALDHRALGHGEARMNICCACWSAYTRATQRWPGLAAIVPFIPVVALWTAVTEVRSISARILARDRSTSSGRSSALTYHGILPDYLQDSLIRLFTGAALGMALGIPLGDPDRHQPVGASRLLADPAVLPGHRRHRLASDPADLVRLRADDHDVRDRLHRAVSGGAQYRARRRIGAARSCARRAQSRRVAGARACGR